MKVSFAVRTRVVVLGASTSELCMCRVSRLDDDLSVASRAVVADTLPFIVNGRSMRIDWVLSGDRVKASSRLQGFSIHQWFGSQGICSKIVCTNANQVAAAPSVDFFRICCLLSLSRAETVIFEGPEWVNLQMAQLCSCWGKKVMAVRCDVLPGEYDKYFDATIVPTQDLANALGIRRSIVIDDIVEVPEDKYKKSYRASGKLRVAWVGHEGYENFIVPFISRLALELAGEVDFEIISSGRFATKQWSEATVFSDILSCDVAIIPVPEGQWFLSKSSNRLAMMMALGMPVIASPIPSYAKIARNEESIIFANLDCFGGALRRFQDESLRQRIGEAGRRAVAGKYSVSVIGSKWRDAIDKTSIAPKLLSLRVRVIARMIRGFVRAVHVLGSRPIELSNKFRVDL